MKPSAGVIGAGIFGVAAALELRELGLDVTLYEKRGDILGGTTARNFFRLHRGYHYPRSLATARQASQGYKSFMFGFAEALAPGIETYYAIAAKGSLTSAQQFAAHCQAVGIEYRPAPFSRLVPGSAEECFEVFEYYYDPERLRATCRERLSDAGVKVELNWQRADSVADAHDVVVVAAYSRMNDVLIELGCVPVELQYELCEVAVVDAGPDPIGLVVMDGPFCSIAPYGDGLHVMYDVVHAVHARANGYLNPGLKSGPTRFPQMLESARRFARLPEVKQAGSLFAERVVLPNADATDARPTRVWWAGPGVISILSGKVTASVNAGRAVAELVAREYDLPAPVASRLES